MSGDEPMRCPKCGEEAVNQALTDLAPWEAHGMPQPEWSHRDGTSLCPVIGPSGGYQPARPQPTPTEPDMPAARPEPPATLRPSMRADIARRLAGPDPALATRTIGALGREHSRRVIALLGEMHRQALRTEPEPEAGA